MANELDILITSNMTELIDDWKKRKDKKKKGVHCFTCEDDNFDMSVLTTVRVSFRVTRFRVTHTILFYHRCMHAYWI